MCLEGLTVVRTLEDGKGFGVDMTHRDGLYPPRKIFFKDEKVLEEWMEFFRFCKGDSVRQRYKFGDKIGTGKFSIVYRGTEVDGGRKVAIKEIINLLLDEEARELIAYFPTYTVMRAASCRWWTTLFCSVSEKASRLVLTSSS